MPKSEIVVNVLLSLGIFHRSSRSGSLPSLDTGEVEAVTLTRLTDLGRGRPAIRCDIPDYDAQRRRTPEGAALSDAKSERYGVPNNTSFLGRASTEPAPRRRPLS
jgi:hypothetical protein